MMNKKDKSNETIEVHTSQSKQKVRLVDIAQRAKVSVSSVSRVVRGMPNIDENIREKVEEAIAEMQVDMSSFSKKTSEATFQYKFIAILTNSIEDPYYVSLVKGIKDVANVHKFHIILSDASAFEDDYQKIKLLVQEHGVNGIIHIPTESSGTLIENILKDKLPLVLTENITVKNQQSYKDNVPDR